MNNVSPFNRRRHPEHEEDQPSTASPDPKELQRLLGHLADALSPRARQGNDQQLRIRNFRSERLELVADLIVVLEDRDGEYVATSYDTGQYGHGYSPDSAIHDLCSMIEDYYDLLTEDEGRISEHLQGHLRYLRSILRARE